jgi:isopentenyl diphosphate isomerase/L-lactate dehydrogenase-like FMN-dependent dehydrogenase
VLETAQDLCEGLRALMVLTGVRRLDEVPLAPRVLGDELRRWLEPESGPC